MATRKRTRHVSPVPRKKARRVETEALNSAPTQKLNVYVFGTNESGEMGLGASVGSDDITIPTLNTKLTAESVGVVQVAAGGMHSAVLTHDGRILTWGVNDLGALGRDTTWDGGLVDVADADDDVDADLNPRESTPAEIDTINIPPGTIFTQVTAGDNATFALTAEGHVFGWGTMRSSEGVAGFQPDIAIQKSPLRLHSLKRVTKILCGNNHVLALTDSGSVYSWGSGEQGQLARRLLERRKTLGLIPHKLNLRNIINIGVGADHSFAIDKSGRVYSWGSNNFGQTGVESNAGEDSAVILTSSPVKSLQGIGKIVDIVGGNKHSLALTEDGRVYTWGQLDGYSTGVDLKKLPSEGVIYDERGKPRILERPTQLERLRCKAIAAGGEHSLAVAVDGTAWSWGFNTNYQTGHRQDDDVEVPTAIIRKSTRDKAFASASAGGNFSILLQHAT